LLAPAHVPSSPVAYHVSALIVAGMFIGVVLAILLLPLKQFSRDE
jgi:hypothetical protein